VEYGLIGTEWENEPEEKKKELVEQACREAFADEFITRLPEVSLSRFLTINRAMIPPSAMQELNLAVANANA
jgi:hypothetical protein